MSPDEFIKLKETTERLEQKYHKTTGAYESLLKRLETFNCRTIEEGNEKLQELENEVAELSKRYDKRLKEFEKLYKDKLEGIND